MTVLCENLHPNQRTEEHLSLTLITMTNTRRPCLCPRHSAVLLHALVLRSSRTRRLLKTRQRKVFRSRGEKWQSRLTLAPLFCSRNHPVPKADTQKPSKNHWHPRQIRIVHPLLPSSLRRKSCNCQEPLLR